MKIKGIFGQEPRRDGEYPEGATVGYDGVTQIVEHLENMGSYGILWFTVFKGDHLSKKLNASHVSQVIYFDESDTGAA